MESCQPFFGPRSFSPTCVITASEVLSSTAVEGKVWSSPALAGGRIYVRAESQLYCFGEKGA